MRCPSRATELAMLGQRHALRLGRPRLLMAWSERWRASALAVPPVRPVDDGLLQADLVALRSITGRLTTAQIRDAPSVALYREQLRLEQAVRVRALRTRGVGPSEGATLAAFDVRELLDELGDDRLVEIAAVDGELQLLICGSGRVRRYGAGPMTRAFRAFDFARFGLNRLARRRPNLHAEQAFNQLCHAGRQLEDALLGQAVRQLGDGALVVVPQAACTPSHGVSCPAFRGGW